MTLLCTLGAAAAFQSSSPPILTPSRRSAPTVSMAGWKANTNYNGMGTDQKQLEQTSERSKRQAGFGDRVVTINKPCGLVLEETENGDVIVAGIQPGSNAEMSGEEIRLGDTISMVSATFGNEMWSTKGTGLVRVQRAIQVRQGSTVSMVLTGGSKGKQNPFANLFKKKASAAEEEAKEKAEVGMLEQEVLEERSQAAKKFFGIF